MLSIRAPHAYLQRPKSFSNKRSASEALRLFQRTSELQCVSTPATANTTDSQRALWGTLVHTGAALLRQVAFQCAVDAEQAQALPYERHLDACLGLVCSHWPHCFVLLCGSPSSRCAAPHCLVHDFNAVKPNSGETWTQTLEQTGRP